MITSITEQLDAVLPLVLRDYERFTILQRSLDLFCQDLIHICWIVTPDADYAELRDRITQEPSSIEYRIIPESSLVPEFKLFRRQKSGWYKQQLVKLAIAQSITTNFYLTLDADVICLRPLSRSDLIANERALCYIHEVDKFPEWYRWSERVLNFKRSGLFHNVTPAVLSKAAVLQLQAHLSQLSSTELNQPVKLPSCKNQVFLLISQLLAKLAPQSSALYEQATNWKSYLLRNQPWTEYSLYYTFLEATDAFDRYHIATQEPIYSIRDSVWLAEQYSSWNPEVAFSKNNQCCFCVIQSTTQIHASEIWQRIQPYLTAQIINSEHSSQISVGGFAPNSPQNP